MSSMSGDKQLLLRNFGRPASPMAHGARPSNSQKRIVKVAPGISPAAGTMPAAGSGSLTADAVSVLDEVTGARKPLGGAWGRWRRTWT